MNSASTAYVNGMGDKHSLIDAMVQPAAVLGPDGRVMAVNNAWRGLAEDGELAAFSLGTGSARTSGCDCGHRDACELSEAAAEGIVDVLFSGKRNSGASAMCEASGRQRWFRIDVGALPLGDQKGALVVCTEVTQYVEQPVETLPAQTRLFA
jgi:PAS fold